MEERWRLKEEKKEEVWGEKWKKDPGKKELEQWKNKKELDPRTNKMDLGNKIFLFLLVVLKDCIWAKNIC